MTAVFAALLEAATQLRVHRVRVLLSLFGVAVAVAALTASVALSDIVRQISTESMEQSSGRPTTLSVNAYFPDTGSIDGDKLVDEVEAISDRYQIAYSGPVAYGSGSLDVGRGTIGTQVLGVSKDYQAMHRLTVQDGRWFDASDAQRLALPVVVNPPLLRALGHESVAERPTLRLADGTTGVVVGVAAMPMYGDQPFMITLYEHLPRVSPDYDAAMYGPPSIELWIPEEAEESVRQVLTRDLRAAFPGAQVDIYRQDYAAYLDQDPTIVLRNILLAISGVVLLLGALSLVNIAVITVRQRVREIGIRRAFGASRNRVFFGVMLESVVGTVVAGAAGIALVVALYRMLPTIGEFFALPLPDDLPGFPLSAAITGLAVATAVGAIAGLIPAVVAVRSKVIDAIRF